MMCNGIICEYPKSEDREKRKRKLVISSTLGRNKELFKSSWQEKTQVFWERKLTVMSIWCVTEIGRRGRNKTGGIFLLNRISAVILTNQSIWGNGWFSSYSNELIPSRKPPNDWLLGNLERYWQKEGYLFIWVLLDGRKGQFYCSYKVCWSSSYNIITKNTQKCRQ